MRLTALVLALALATTLFAVELTAPEPLPRYFIRGNVSRPGAVLLREPTRVLQALVSAGGFQGAGKERIVIIRAGDYIPFDYRDVIKGRNLDQNIFLRPGDIIVVSW
jgi:polysaccharide export outer membrane protein